MVNNKTTAWICCQCPRETTTLHEVFFGTANRPISVIYHIQVPVCEDHHKKAHGQHKYNDKSQEMYRMTFCQWLDISYIKCLQSFNGLDNKNYLFEVMDKCKNRIDNAESI